MKHHPLRRLLCLLLALALAAGLLPVLSLSFPASAEYYDESVEKLVNWGVLRGYPDGSLDPEVLITRAEFVAMMNRAYGYTQTGAMPFTDVHEWDWYADDISIAYNAGYFQGTSSSTAEPEENLTREQAMVMLAKNMRLDPLPGEVSDFSDAREFSTWSRGYVRAAVDKGLIQGYEDHSFRPQGEITRGEMAVLLDRAVGNLVNTSGEHSLGNVYGNVTLNTPDTRLQDTTVAGDLYITGGLGLGAVALENVRVLGDIVVAGGGESEAGESILLRNTTAEGLTINSMADQYLSVRADGDTNIEDVSVRTSSFIIDRTEGGLGLQNITLESEERGARFSLAGNLENVVNKSPGSTLQVSSGTAQNIVVDEDARGSRLQLDTNARARTLDLDVPIAVSGNGDVDKLNVNTAGTSTEMLPDAIEIRPGLTAVINGETMDTALGRESGEEPRLQAGYPRVGNIASTSATVTFATNKAGTVYWAVSALSDGSINAEDLLAPSFNPSVVSSGNVQAARSNTDITSNVTGLTAGGSYYLSAMLVDARGDQSPVKVVSFTAPDNSVPAFSTGYPTFTRITSTAAQISVMTTKSCDLYFAVLPAGSSTPTTSEFRSAAINGVYGYGVIPVNRNEPEVFYVNNIQDLVELTSYDLYLWLNDADNAKSSAIIKRTFTTLDATPPVFLTIPTVTNYTSTSIRMNTVLNENGTVYWVAVPLDVEYPKLDTNNALTLEWAIVQIENGSNAGTTGKAGRVNVRANADATINITGLRPETQYKIYYMGKDAAGNYTQITILETTINNRTQYEVQEYVIQGTLDTNPPTATQEFTRYSGTETTRPFANTDVRIIFSEDVLWTKAPSADIYQAGRLLDLYMQASATGAGQSAKDAFHDALFNTIKLYDATGVNASNPPRVVERTENGQAGTWGIDYRNATVELNGSQLIVTFPAGEALNLNSGSTYYFQLEDLADTSVNRNTMGVTQLPRFTTISAQVAMEDLNLTRLQMEGEGRPVEIDVAFTISPTSTTMVDPSTDWDMLIWADASIDYSLYRRPGVAEGRENTNAWEKLPGLGSIAFTSDYSGTYLGQTLNQHFATDTVTENHPLYLLDQKWEYAVHIDKLNESENRAAWAQSITFQINIMAGSYRSLQTLATNVTEQTYTDSITGNSPWSQSSMLEDIGIPEQFHLVAPFTDTAPPDFSDGYPQFTPYDSSMQMLLMLNRPGTVYYVVAPFTVTPSNTETQNLALSPTINTRDINNNALLGEVDPESMGTSTDSSRRYYRAMDVPTTGIDNSLVSSPDSPDWQSPFELSMPITSAIYSPRYTNPSIKTGSITLGEGAMPITIEGLEPQVNYFVYFVLRGNGQIYSPNVLLYQFRTTPVDRPIIELSLNNPSVSIRSKDKEGGDVAANVHYQLVTYNLATMASDLTDVFDGDRYINPDGPDPDITSRSWEDYKRDVLFGRELNVLEAMATDFSIAGNSQGSVFDIYASDSAKDRLAEYIRNRAPTGGSIVKTGTTNLPVTVNRVQNYITSVDCSDSMSESMWYAFLAVGRNPNGSGDSFRSIYPVQIIDEEAPKVTVANLTGNFDPATGTFPDGGTLIIQFDEPLYYKEQAAQDVTQIIRPVVGVGILTAREVEDINPLPVSIDSVTRKPSLYSLEEPADREENAHAARTACQTLVYNFSQTFNNDTITFDSELCDASGNTRLPPLSIQVVIGRDRSGDYQAAIVIPSSWDGRVG